MKPSIIIWVRAGENYGFGHLSRSIYLSKKLKNRYSVLLCISGKINLQYLSEINFIKYQIIKNNSEIIKLIQKLKPVLSILDLKKSSKKDLLAFRKYSKILSIDDFSISNIFANITIYSLPIPNNINNNANFSGLEYLLLGNDLKPYLKNVRDKFIRRIVVSFGGEDPYRMTEKVKEILQPLQKLYKIIYILGPLYKNSDENFKNVDFIRHPENLFSELSRYDCLITSFGLTVYEALYLGLKVITINPTNYHNDLASQNRAIINLGTILQDKLQLFIALEKVLNEKYSEIKYSETRQIIQKLNYAEDNLLNLIDKVVNLYDDFCPICKAIPEVIYREKIINYYHCNNCFSFFRSRLYNYELNYSDYYFTLAYKKQYGKTYLEDKSNINALNKVRLEVLEKIFKNNFKTKQSSFKMLELGSAMGFFLEMAREKGYEVEGIEISNYAANYAKNYLNMKIFQGDFKDFNGAFESYDIICAWYFIEHHKDYKFIIKKIKDLLKIGGILALSTPNSYGISFRKNREKYIHNIPSDHFIEFSPKSLNLLLNSYGFKTQEICMTGLHIDRFSKLMKIKAFNNKIIKSLIHYLMRKFYLGDTFEIYLQKSY